MRLKKKKSEILFCKTANGDLNNRENSNNLRLNRQHTV